MAGPGSGVLIHPARPRVVGLTLAKHGVLAPVAFGPPALWAITGADWALAGALCLSSVLGFALFVATYRTKMPSDLRQVEALVTLALLFLATALLSVPAFMVLGMPPVPALFEGMSAVTTTGLSMARDPDAWPFAAHALRAWVQWCGGLVMATAVLAFLLGPGQASAQMGKQGVDMGDRLASTRAQARQLLTVYAGLTLAFALPAMAIAPDWRQGLVLILSAVSTGGFAPLSTSLATYDPALQALVICACLTGAISLLTVVLAAQGKWRQAWDLGSLRRTGLALIAAFALWVLVSGGLTWNGALNLISAMTTAGFSASAMPPGAPLALLVGVMLLGGSVGSTAGGLKLDRIALALRAIRHAMIRTQMPDRAVLTLRSRRGAVDVETLIRLVALFALTLLITAALWLALVAAGYPALPALFDTVSALATTGLSAGVVGPDLPTPLALAFTCVMWAGRLEFFAVLLLIWPRTWRKPE